MGKIIDYINEQPLGEVWRELFGYEIPTGKFTCPNPLHQHKSNTPSCKVYGNKFKCFGQCNRMFGVYDLLKWYDPGKINEYKSKVVMTEPTRRRQERIKKLNITGTSEEKLKQIIWLAKQ